MPSPSRRPTGGVVSPQIFAGKVFPEPRQYLFPVKNDSWAGSVVGNGTILFAPFSVPSAATFSCADVFVSNSYSATNAISSRADAVSMSVGVYSAIGSSLSLLASGSQTYAFTVTGSSSAVSYDQVKNLTVPVSLAVAPGDYWYAVVSSATSVAGGHAIAGALSNVVASVVGGESNYRGQFGQSSNASNQVEYGLGRYSATSSALPSSVGFSQIVGTAFGNTARHIIAFKNYTA